MDKIIPLARQEEDGQPVLLASIGAGVHGEEGIHGEEGQEISSATEGDEGAKVSNTEKKSKARSKAKGGDGGGRKHRHTHPPGKPARVSKGKNRPSGRSAKELGIVWIGSRCEDSPVTKAHHMIGRISIDQGEIFECKYCHKVKWLPKTEAECTRMGNWLQVHGKDEGYQRTLDSHPAAKRLISKIQDIYYLKKTVPASKFPLILAAVMLDREYPYDVEITEEEVL